MSYEFSTRTDRPLASDDVARLKRYIQDHSTYRIVRDGLREFGLGLTQDDRPAPVSEVITVLVRPNEVYVAFHACNGTQREAFVQCLVDALAQDGIVGNFEEL